MISDGILISDLFPFPLVLWICTVLKAGGTVLWWTLAVWKILSSWPPLPLHTHIHFSLIWNSHEMLELLGWVSGLISFSWEISVTWFSSLLIALYFQLTWNYLPVFSSILHFCLQFLSLPEFCRVCHLTQQWWSSGGLLRQVPTTLSFPCLIHLLKSCSMLFPPIFILVVL